MANRLGVRLDILAENGGFALSHRDKAAHRSDQSSFAGAVGTEQAKNLADADTQRSPIDRGEGAELNRGLANVNGQISHGVPLSGNRTSAAIPALKTSVSSTRTLTPKT